MLLLSSSIHLRLMSFHPMYKRNYFCFIFIGFFSLSFPFKCSTTINRSALGNYIFATSECIEYTDGCHFFFNSSLLNENDNVHVAHSMCKCVLVWIRDVWRMRCSKRRRKTLFKWALLIENNSIEINWF